MLDLAQADGQSFETNTAVDLREVGRRAVDYLSPVAKSAGRKLILEEHGHSIVQGHAEAIFRVFRNLIENAMCHAPGETPIHVDVGPGPRFSVRDFGPGIPEPDVPRIFDRFWRKNSSNGNGAGLGLGIVKRLIEAHGGTVNFDNADGGGARFTVLFPTAYSPPLGSSPS